MHIIFGQDEAHTISSKYTVLELDIIQVGINGPKVQAYCVIENLPILDLPQVESMSLLHKNLMSHYGKQDWKYCLDAIETLTGFWGGEVDSFYTEMSQRIAQFQDKSPGPDWDPVVLKLEMHS